MYTIYQGLLIIVCCEEIVHYKLVSRVIHAVSSKINGIPKGFYLPISKLHSIYLLIINYGYYGQVNSLQLKSRVASKWASKHLWGYHLFCC